MKSSAEWFDLITCFWSLYSFNEMRNKTESRWFKICQCNINTAYKTFFYLQFNCATSESTWQVKEGNKITFVYW